MLRTAIRLLVWLCVLSALLGLGYWKPAALAVLGVVLAVVLVVSKLVGDFLWSDHTQSVTPTAIVAKPSGSPSAQP